jgi:hypothetical protein
LPLDLSLPAGGMAMGGGGWREPTTAATGATHPHRANPAQSDRPQSARCRPRQRTGVRGQESGDRGQGTGDTAGLVADLITGPERQVQPARGRVFHGNDAAFGKQRCDGGVIVGRTASEIQVSQVRERLQPPFWLRGPGGEIGFVQPALKCQTPAPFTSRSPGVATLGPSCTPNGQSGIGQKTSQRRKGSDVVIVQGCSLNRQLAGQRRRWESNPLESCFAGSRRTVWLQRHWSVLARNRT